MVDRPGRRDGQLKRSVGFYGLMMVSLGSIIGSGWLPGAVAAGRVRGAERRCRVRAAERAAVDGVRAARQLAAEFRLRLGFGGLNRREFGAPAVRDVLEDRR